MRGVTTVAHSTMIRRIDAIGCFLPYLDMLLVGVSCGQDMLDLSLVCWCDRKPAHSVWCRQYSARLGEGASPLRVMLKNGRWLDKGVRHLQISTMHLISGRDCHWYGKRESGSNTRRARHLYIPTMGLHQLLHNR